MEEKEEKKDTREYPCPECENGELMYVRSTPTQFGQTMTYECDHCGYEISFP